MLNVKFQIGKTPLPSAKSSKMFSKFILAVLPPALIHMHRPEELFRLVEPAMWARLQSALTLTAMILHAEIFTRPALYSLDSNLSIIVIKLT